MVRDLKKKWEADVSKRLVGRTIESVRYLTKEECGDWYRSPLAIFFDDGNYILATSDDDGNDAGSYSTSYDGLPVIPVV